MKQRKISEHVVTFSFKVKTLFVLEWDILYLRLNKTIANIVTYMKMVLIKIIILRLKFVKTLLHHPVYLDDWLRLVAPFGSYSIELL